MPKESTERISQKSEDLDQLARNSNNDRRRRNGRKSSCEPCRLSKLKCDHELPCARCKRYERRCYFHPNPLSRKVRPAAKPCHSSTVAITTVPDSGSNKLTNKSLASPNPLKFATGSIFSGIRRSSKYVPGYTGRTSHSAILEETNATLREDVGSLADDYSTCYNSGDTDGAQGSNDASRYRMGMAILAWLPDESTSSEVVRQYVQQTCSLTLQRLAFHQFHDDLWTTFGHLLRQPRRPSQLSRLCKILCTNQKTPLPVPQSSPGFLASFTGENSRWDHMGTLFAGIGACAYLDLCEKPVTNELIGSHTRLEFAAIMFDCAEACLMLSMELEPSGSVLTLMLHFRLTCFQGLFGGGGNSQLWKRAGSLAAATTALGLHREEPFNDSGSLLYQNLRRLLFISIFNFTSVCAAFHGRPPLLTRTFVTTKPPLDASEEELMTDDVDQIRTGLDERGWTRSGHLYPSSVIRTVYTAALHLDEILELSLGPKLESGQLEQRISDLEHRIRERQTGGPPTLRLAITRENLKRLSRWENAKLQPVRLHWQHQLFLLQRLRHSIHSRATCSGCYLRAASDVVNSVVVIWQERDMSFYDASNVAEYATLFGVPSATSLAVHLYEMSTQVQALQQSDINRSKAIQDLTLFAACLEWTPEYDGNYDFCQRVAKWLKNMLDRILSPPVFDLPAFTPFDVPGFDFSNLSSLDVPTFSADFGNWFSVDPSCVGIAFS